MNFIIMYLQFLSCEKIISTNYKSIIHERIFCKEGLYIVVLFLNKNYNYHKCLFYISPMFEDIYYVSYVLNVCLAIFMLGLAYVFQLFVKKKKNYH